MSLNNLMLDIETMGNRSNSAIVSIGGVHFDIETGKTGSWFSCNIDLQSCIDLGLGVDGSTVMWWLQQSEEARKVLVEPKIPPLPIKEALELFAIFTRSVDGNVWGNSARFDCGILSDAYNKAGIQIPWDFRKERCVRTLVSLAPTIKDLIERDLEKHPEHVALSDCYYQIHYVCDTWKYLKERK